MRELKKLQVQQSCLEIQLENRSFLITWITEIQGNIILTSNPLQIYGNGKMWISLKLQLAQKVNILRKIIHKAYMLKWQLLKSKSDFLGPGLPLPSASFPSNSVGEVQETVT